MRKLLLVIAGLLLSTASASAQCGYCGDIGRSHGYVPSGGPYRAINIDPATGRTYAKEAEYNFRTTRSTRPRKE
jgi:hypothetical protein